MSMNISNSSVNFVWVHQSINKMLRQQLIHFWLRHRAIIDPFEAWRRSFEVCCLAMDANHEILAVCSIYPARSEADGQPCWMFRAFVSPLSRRVGILNRMFDITCEKLEKNGLEFGGPIGVEFVTENRKLNKRGLARWLKRKGYVFQAENQLGQAIWRKLFQ